MNGLRGSCPVRQSSKRFTISSYSSRPTICMKEPATSGCFSSVMYSGRSFKATLTAKIGVVFEKRKFAASSAKLGSRFSLPTTSELPLLENNAEVRCEFGETRVEVLLTDKLDECLHRI